MSARFPTSDSEYVYNNEIFKSFYHLFYRKCERKKERESERKRVGSLFSRLNIFEITTALESRRRLDYTNIACYIRFWQQHCKFPKNWTHEHYICLHTYIDSAIQAKISFVEDFCSISSYTHWCWSYSFSLVWKRAGGNILAKTSNNCSFRRDVAVVVVRSHSNGFRNVFG